VVFACRRIRCGQRLFAATEELVREGSFTEVSVERLAAAAGISRSTFYVHFQDKGDLVRKLAKTVPTQLREVSDRWWTVAEQADPTQLKAAVAAIVDIYRRHPAAFTAMAETATYDPSWPKNSRPPCARSSTPPVPPSSGANPPA
jgi:AcrR family transcriptional regulator